MYSLQRWTPARVCSFEEWKTAPLVLCVHHISERYSKLHPEEAKEFSVQVRLLATKLQACTTAQSARPIQEQLNLLRSQVEATPNREDAKYLMYDRKGNPIAYRAYSKPQLLIGMSQNKDDEISEVIRRRSHRQMEREKLLEELADNVNSVEEYDELDGLLDLASMNAVANTRFAQKGAPFNPPSNQKILPAWTYSESPYHS